MGETCYVELFMYLLLNLLFINISFISILLLLLLLLSDLGNARVIIEAVLLIETITPINLYLYIILTIVFNT